MTQWLTLHLCWFLFNKIVFRLTTQKFAPQKTLKLTGQKKCPKLFWFQKLFQSNGFSLSRIAEEKFWQMFFLQYFSFQTIHKFGLYI